MTIQSGLGQRFTNLPLARKLALIILGTSAIALLLAGVAFTGVEIYSARQRAHTELLTLAHVLAENSSAALSLEDKRGVQEILVSLKSLSEIAILLPAGFPAHSFSAGRFDFGDLEGWFFG